MRFAISVVFLAGLVCDVTAQEAIVDRKQVYSVLEFDYDDGLPVYQWIGKYLANALSGALSNIDSIEVVDREMLPEIFEEIRLSLSGLGEEENSQFSGIKIADYFVKGSFAVSSSGMSINIRIVDVQTTTIKTARSIEISSVDLDQAEQECINIIATALGVKSPIARKANVDLRAHRSIDRAQVLWRSLPYHELHPRRRRMQTDFQFAIDQLEEVLLQNPEIEEVYYLTGEFYLQLGDPKTASLYFENLISVGEGSGLAHTGFGDMYRYGNQCTEALAHYESALELTGKHPGALYGKAKCLLELSDYNNATLTLVKLLQIEPTLGIAYQLLLTLAEKLENQKSHFTSEASDILRSIVLFERAEYKNASEIVTRYEDRYPNLYIVDLIHGFAKFQQGDQKLAIPYLLKAQSLNPLADATYKFLGHSYFEIGQWQQAHDYYITYLNISKGGSDFADINARIQECIKRL